MPSKRPLIGITLGQALESKQCRWPMRWQFDYLGKAYHYAIEKSGGQPVGLFSTKNADIINSYLEFVDGILLTGGIDVHPKYFNQKPHSKTSELAEPRDFFELVILKKTLKLKKPVFCICRGHQLLNIALGGTLYQDISLYPAKTLEHADEFQTGKVNHFVGIEKKSLLYDIIGKQKIFSNSSHHQCINKPAKGLQVSAVASDGIVEGLELEGYPFLISVQWHPERIFKRSHSRKLFKAFMNRARKGT